MSLPPGWYADWSSPALQLGETDLLILMVSLAREDDGRIPIRATSCLALADHKRIGRLLEAGDLVDADPDHWAFGATPRCRDALGWVSRTLAAGGVRGPAWIDELLNLPIPGDDT